MTSNQENNLDSHMRSLREFSARLVDPNLSAEIFEHLPDAMIVVNSLGQIQHVNRQAELMFGYHRSELYDKPVEELMPRQIRQQHESHRQGFFYDPRARPMAAAQEMPLKALRKDGSELIVEINLSPIVTATGGILVLAVIRKRGS